MANCVFSISCLSCPAGSVNRCGRSPVGQVGEVALGQALQLEARAARPQHQLARVAAHVERDLGAVGELADDVVQHMGRQGGAPVLGDIGLDFLGDFEVEIGGLELKRPSVGPNQDVAKDRDGGASLDDAVDVAERFQQRGAFECDFHGGRPILV